MKYFLTEDRLHMSLSCISFYYNWNTLNLQKRARHKQTFKQDLVLKQTFKQKFVLKRVWTVIASLTNERLRSVSARTFLRVGSDDGGQLRLCILKHRKPTRDITDTHNQSRRIKCYSIFFASNVIWLVSGKDKEGSLFLSVREREINKQKTTISILHTFLCCQKNR